VYEYQLNDVSCPLQGGFIYGVLGRVSEVRLTNTRFITIFRNLFVIVVNDMTHDNVYNVVVVFQARNVECSRASAEQSVRRACIACKVRGSQSQRSKNCSGVSRSRRLRYDCSLDFKQRSIF